MIKEFEGNLPAVHDKAYIAEGAMVVGKVWMDEFSSLWHNTVLRGDVNIIKIGKYTNIQDNSIVHVADEYPTIIGDYVTVGHGAILHGCEIEDHCLIGMGTIILNGVKVGKGSIIAAGTVITEEQTIPENSLVVGSPSRIVRTLSNRLESIHAQALKYKSLWTERYGIMPDVGGEKYGGEKIV